MMTMKAVDPSSTHEEDETVAVSPSTMEPEQPHEQGPCAVFADDNDSETVGDDDDNDHKSEEQPRRAASQVGSDDNENENEEEYVDRRAIFAEQAAWKQLATINLEIQEEAKKYLFPQGCTKHLIPLCLSILALTFTAAGSWDCSYFRGASIGFTGGSYGLWTLQDSNGTCQLWDVLFFSYNLGPPLMAARVFSMASMLLGLGLTATMAQASQFHLASWGLGLVLIILFLVSLSTSSIYNVWIVFWFLTYLFMVLIVRFTFIHPVHRRISQSGSKIISGFFAVCAVCCIFTLGVLKSDFCTCSGLTTARLDDRDPGDPCNGTCQVGPAGYCMVVASVFYIASAVACLTFGIQPEVLKQNKRRPVHLYAHYPQQSIISRIRGMAGGFYSRKSTATASATATATTARTSAITRGSATNKSTTASTTTADNNNNVNNHRNIRKLTKNSSITTTNSSVNNTSTSSIPASFQDEGDAVSNASGDNNNNKVPPTLNAIGEDHEITPPEVVPSSLDIGDDHCEENNPDEHDDNVEDADDDDDNEDEETWEDILEPEQQQQQQPGANPKDPRNACQKCCCDFQVVPRTRREKIRFWIFRTCLGLGFVVYAVMVYILMGSRLESTNAATRPDTTPFFTMSQVCAFDPQNPNAPFQTFPDETAAHAQNWAIAHCGECGYCSNPHDIITYVETRTTIAQSSKTCGPTSFLGNYEDLADCLEEAIGFRRECTNCWADNMISTGDECLATCMRTLFSGFMTDNNIPGAGDQGWMNQCLFCDEKMSGPNFITCSGVARRRLGIASEIERNPLQQCTRVDVDWARVNFEEIGFYKDVPGYSAAPLFVPPVWLWVGLVLLSTFSWLV